MIFFEAIVLALSTPSRRVLSKYDLSSNNFLISVEIGWILSTRTSDNFCLNSEKFLPAKFSDSKPWGIITKKQTYTEESVGLIARFRNPYNPDYYILVVAGIRFIGTKAAVFALTRNTKQILNRFTGQKEFYSIVQGFDLSGDGKIDSIEVLEWKKLFYYVYWWL